MCAESQTYLPLEFESNPRPTPAHSTSLKGLSHPKQHQMDLKKTKRVARRPIETLTEHHRNFNYPLRNLL